MEKNVKTFYNYDKNYDPGCLHSRNPPAEVVITRLDTIDK